MAAGTTHRNKRYSLVGMIALCGLLVLGAAVWPVQASGDPPHKYSQAVEDKVGSAGPNTIDLIVMYNARPGAAEQARIGALGGNVSRQFLSIDGFAAQLPGLRG